MHSTPAELAWLTRSDGSVVVGHGPMTASASAPAEGVAFYQRDFAAESASPWRIPATWEILTREQFAAHHPLHQAPQCSWQPVDTICFSEVFQEIMTSIRAGHFEKTVPVVTEQGIWHGVDRGQLVAAMAHCQLPLQSYGYLEGDRGFAGATPELLFTLQDRHLQTMALAGTARSDDRDIFAVDEKEIREHEYVAHTLVAKLLELGSLERGQRRILDLGHLVHFLTPIRVELHETMAPQQLLRRLHPTPALGPLPRTDTTMARLIEWRGRLGCPASFGAPYGVWQNGRFDAIVAIRGVWWQGERVEIPAGCGIIEASRMVNEWRELRLKREAVKQLFEGAAGPKKDG
ncbi:MAG TPA: chorismate-binding protein [Luteolibacter sp.]|nr:chorismate-binding protein [Luteolibacter sp.]